MRNNKKNLEDGKYIRPEVKVIEMGPQFSVLDYQEVIPEEDLN